MSQIPSEEIKHIFMNVDGKGYMKEISQINYDTLIGLTMNLSNMVDLLMPKEFYDGSKYEENQRDCLIGLINSIMGKKLAKNDEERKELLISVVDLVYSYEDFDDGMRTRIAKLLDKIHRRIFQALGLEEIFKGFIKHP
jgi:methyl coenzyme M reductase subunit C-like uncharacterized protein (methanogenesis marker protein 7)